MICFKLQTTGFLIPVTIRATTEDVQYLLVNILNKPISCFVCLSYSRISPVAFRCYPIISKSFTIQSAWKVTTPPPHNNNLYMVSLGVFVWLCLCGVASVDPRVCSVVEKHTRLTLADTI